VLPFNCFAHDGLCSTYEDLHDGHTQQDIDCSSFALPGTKQYAIGTQTRARHLMIDISPHTVAQLLYLVHGDPDELQEALGEIRPAESPKLCASCLPTRPGRSWRRCRST
jgi:hypothetical protein